MEKENRRIKGAHSVEFDNIKFKSALECSCYKKLKESGLEFNYESERIIIWEGLKLKNTKLYLPNKICRILEEYNKKLLNITYTPDFVVIKDNYKIYFDVKGKENDVYPIKRKMFLKYLEEKQDDWIYIFFEPHYVKQMIQAIDCIKNLNNSIN